MKKKRLKTPDRIKRILKIAMTLLLTQRMLEANKAIEALSDEASKEIAKIIYNNYRRRAR